MRWQILFPKVECIFVRKAEQFELGQAVFCAERAVRDDLFAVLLADYKPSVTADLVCAFVSTGKSQLSVMELDELDISKYGVVVSHGFGAGIAFLIAKSDAS